MKVYVTVKQGVCMHALVGVRQSFDAAVEQARNAAFREGDGYHTFDVFQLDTEHPGIFPLEGSRTTYNEAIATIGWRPLKKVARFPDEWQLETVIRYPPDAR